MEATGKPDAIRFILSGRSAMPSAERLEAIARVLMTTPAYLLGATDDPSPLSGVLRKATDRRVALFPPDTETEEYTIRPVDTVDGISIFQAKEIAEDKRKKVDRRASIPYFDMPRVFMSAVLPLPPGLASRKLIYGFYCTTTALAPRYDIGDLIVIDPSRPATERDYVILYHQVVWQNTNEVPVHPAVLGRLISQDREGAVIETFNPAARVTITREFVREIHRILPTAELLGG